MQHYVYYQYYIYFMETRYQVRVCVTGSDPVDREFRHLLKARSFFGDKVKSGQEFKRSGYWCYAVHLLDLNGKYPKTLTDFFRTSYSKGTVRPHDWTR